MKSIVIYFSAETGKTRKIAEELAAELGADIFEIKPEQPYTAADIKWTNPLARCNKEKLGKKDVPVVGKIGNWDEYDTVYLGFPIWYYGAPNVVNTFCKGYDWKGKTLHIFATSGGSGIGKTAEKLAPYVGGQTSQMQRESRLYRRSQFDDFVIGVARPLNLFYTASGCAEA
ncbi:Flavodoxin [Ruminococcus sp. YRD2003]|uniref:flavodoxin n=1 Tax=Ruminococcus sp. YRD2003 TaxID=1452313 RepID=UPI0008B9B190|nr:Flavodoxin [Ruminococcus flavefaciens]